MSSRKLVPYAPPAWAAHLKHVPRHRVHLIHSPTPVQPWRFADADGRRYELLIKRDDLTELVQGGNKSRKLEFLFAAALDAEADAVVTIGGTGSNHCRAVASFAGSLGFDCHLVLRRDTYFDGAVQGNLLLDNVYGAHAHLVTRERYQQEGSAALIEGLAKRLVQDGRAKKPYTIPVGGSNPIGAWGYIEAVRELSEQLPADEKIDCAVFASGSGGTASGLAIGMALCPRFHGTRVIGYIVCDNTDYFYDHVQGEMDALGVQGKARDLIEFRDARGLGYSMVQPEEIALIRSIARTSGVLLDPTYSGKAAFGLTRDMRAGTIPEKALFIHTGGAMGVFGLPADKIVDSSLVNDY